RMKQHQLLSASRTESFFDRIEGSVARGLGDKQYTVRLRQTSPSPYAQVIIRDVQDVAMPILLILQPPIDDDTQCIIKLTLGRARLPILAIESHACEHGRRPKDRQAFT